MLAWGRRVRGKSSGFTTIELLVAVAVGGLVMAAIVPLVLLLSRTFDVWSANTHARALGLLAEGPLASDLRALVVEKVGADTLVLRAVPNPGRPGPGTYCVRYEIEGAALDRQLVRIVFRPDRTIISQSTVAHGVSSFAADWSGDQVEVTLTVQAVAGGSDITLDPALLVTPRSPVGGRGGPCA